MPRLPHPLHPALVHFPVACWVLAAPCDIAAWWTDDPDWTTRARELIAAGLILALPAMAAGIAELARITDRPNAAASANRHMLLVGTAWLTYLLSWLVRVEAVDRDTVPGWTAPALSVLGLAALIAGAWFGGKLVYEHGIGQRR